MISAVPSVSSVHVELDGRLPSTAGRTDETAKIMCERREDMVRSLTGRQEVRINSDHLSRRSFVYYESMKVFFPPVDDDVLPKSQY
jgi:hypothetical protein